MKIGRRGFSFVFWKIGKVKIFLWFLAALFVSAAFYDSKIRSVVYDIRSYFVSANVFIVQCFSAFNSNLSKISYFFSSDFDQEIARLKNENLDFKNQLSNVDNIRKDNIELRKLLSLKDMYNDEAVAASVLTIFTNDYVKSCVIDVGHNSGITEDDIVINECGLIGRVIDVKDNWSAILFITDNNSNVPVKIGKENVNAIVSGDNTSTPKVTIVHDDLETREGDVIVTSSYGGIYKEGILLGKVIKQGDDFFVKTNVDFRNIKHVIVLKKNAT